MAVLGATAGLGGEDSFDLHRVAAPFEANLVGKGGKGRAPPPAKRARPNQRSAK